MDSNQRNGRIIGVLLLIVMISWTIGDTLIGSVLNSPDYLSVAKSNSSKLLAGVFFEIIDVLAVIGITAIMVPIIKKRNVSMAVVYLSFRILECIPLLIGLISPVILIPLSEEFVSAQCFDTSFHKTIGALLIDLRLHWALLVNSIFYSLGALIFYSFLYRLKLIPRFISIWGLIAVAMLLIDRIIFEFSGITLGAISNLPILGLHLGIIEIFLGLWLLVKGFNKA